MKWRMGSVDKWVGYHFLIGYFVGNLLQQGFHWGFLGIVVAFLIGLGLEVFKSIFWFLPDWKFPVWFPIFGGCEIFDPDGGNVVDIIGVAIGCIGAVWI